MPTERTPRTVRLLTVVVVAATFVAGFTSGAGFHRWATGEYGPPPAPPMVSSRVLHELNLSPDQREKADQILERYRPKLETILESTFPKVKRLRTQAEQEVRGILTAEQRSRFDEIRARRPPPRRPGPPLPHGDGFPPPGASKGPPWASAPAPPDAAPP
jgi:Spy/CpxP family protein refolding chaperone